jgi:hypothetical protein
MAPPQSQPALPADVPDNELFGSQAFLEDQNVSSAILCTVSGRVVTCEMSKRFYRRWIWLGLILGVVPTILVLPAHAVISGHDVGLRHAATTAPLPVQIVGALIILLGWMLLLRGLFSRRSVTFDFGKGIVSLSKRSIWSSERVETVQLSQVREFALAKLPADRTSSGGQSLPRCLVHLRLHGGRDIPIVKTIDSAVARRIENSLADAANGTRFQTQENRGDGNVVAEIGARPAIMRGTPIISILWLFAAGVGVFLMAMNGMGIYRSIVARHWPATTATVQSARVWHDPQWHDSTTLGYYRTLSALSEIRYAYTFRDIRYVGTGIATDKSPDRDAAIVQSHPPGATLQIFFDPANPAKAVIDPYLSWSTPSLFLAGAALLFGYLAWIRLHNRVG